MKNREAYSVSWSFGPNGSCIEVDENDICIDIHGLGKGPKYNELIGKHIDDIREEFKEHLPGHVISKERKLLL